VLDVVTAVAEVGEVRIARPCGPLRRGTRR
jgi:hypothetical protein